MGPSLLEEIVTNSCLKRFQSLALIEITCTFIIKTTNFAIQTDRKKNHFMCSKLFTFTAINIGRCDEVWTKKGFSRKKSSFFTHKKIMTLNPVFYIEVIPKIDTYS